MSRVAREIVAKLDAATPLQSYVSKPKTLFEVLNVQRSNGVGSRVQQTRWAEKGFDGCYWMVTNVRYKNIKGQPVHGKALGIKYWRGKQVSERPERIPGTLKYYWQLYDGPLELEKAGLQP